jgi:hypothetical protein
VRRLLGVFPQKLLPQVFVGKKYGFKIEEAAVRRIFISIFLFCSSENERKANDILNSRSLLIFIHGWGS